MLKKGVFIRTGSWPPANESVYRALQQQLPDAEIDLIELRPLLKKRPDILLINLVFILRYYGLSILLGRKKLKDSFFRTPYIFHTIQRLIAKLLAKKKYDFSFQMQSIFDASCEGIPHYIYTDHTHLANIYYPDFDTRKLYSKAWIKLEQTIYQNATVNFTRSSNIKRSITEQYSCDPAKVVCVYAGSNTEKSVVPCNDQKYASKNILFVGIDWQRKGGPELLEAFIIVRQAHPDARLTIVGCSPQVDIPGCHVVGRVPLDQVNAYYEQAALFCLPTKIEPFGIVFIEAMSHKLPLVSTNIGALPDLIVHGENGYMVELGDIKSLAQVLTNLLDDPHRCRSFGEKSYSLVQQRYSWENVTTAMKAQMLATASGRSPVAAVGSESAL